MRVRFISRYQNQNEYDVTVPRLVRGIRVRENTRTGAIACTDQDATANEREDACVAVEAHIDAGGVLALQDGKPFRGVSDETAHFRGC